MHVPHVLHVVDVLAGVEQYECWDGCHQGVQVLSENAMGLEVGTILAEQWQHDTSLGELVDQEPWVRWLRTTRQQ